MTCHAVVRDRRGQHHDVRRLSSQQPFEREPIRIERIEGMLAKAAGVQAVLHGSLTHASQTLFEGERGIERQCVAKRAFGAFCVDEVHHMPRSQKGLGDQRSGRSDAEVAEMAHVIDGGDRSAAGDDDLHGVQGRRVGFAGRAL